MTKALKLDNKLPKLTTCCICINLRTGVLLISIIWMLYGLLFSIVHLLYTKALKKSTNDAYNYPAAILYLFIIVASIYGIIVVAFAESIGRLKIHAILTYVIATLITIMSITEITVYTLFKTTFLQDCTESNPSNVCEKAYNLVLQIIITTKIIAAVLSIYFLLVVNSYVVRRRKIEKMYDIDIESVKEAAQ
ncbi:14309_t:CDS:2 [Ambispora leptoticha]|uniref:14309_t:CDS:1 n=1 Tax=Ambispora leptoticha TaxID=144679 RepID=A0A9N8VXZ1_9GLOM|nr:14309_t:CDS:2 [Ambispora leptoticha]